MGCGCGGSKNKQAPAVASPRGSGDGPQNPKGSYYWTGPKAGNAPKDAKPGK